MKPFRQFIIENLSAPEKLKHLEHPEDLMINHGHEGFEHALDALKDTHEKIKGGFNSTKVTEKYDGCVDANTVLITSSGDMTIAKVIVSGNLAVLQQDLDTGEITMQPVIGRGITESNKGWVELQFENGGVLICTADHPVYTENRAWVPAIELTDEDDVRAY